MQGWGGSYRGGVDHTGVRWVIQGWGGSCRGGVGHAGMGVRWVILRQDGVGHKNIKILKILNCWCYRVSNTSKSNSDLQDIKFLKP